MKWGTTVRKVDSLAPFRRRAMMRRLRSWLLWIIIGLSLVLGGYLIITYW